MRAMLHPEAGGPPIPLTRDVTIVGRGEAADLRIEHKSVSKLHCVLVATDGLVVLRDLGSTNGTRVNGQRVRRGALLPNDRIAFANFRYTLAFTDTIVQSPGDVGAIDGEFSMDQPEEDSAEVAPKPDQGVRRNDLPDAYGS